MYPALAVLQAMPADTQTLWVGSQGGLEAPLVQRANIRFEGIPAAGVHGVGLKRLPGNLLSILKGTLAARKIVTAFKPDLIFFTGGFIAFPIALAALRIPKVLFVPDVEPGLALKVISFFAERIALSAEASRRFYRDQNTLLVTGYPIRQEIGKQDKQTARMQMGLSGEKPVVLFFGGSKGAHSINQAVFNNLDPLLQMAQVIHITGEGDWPDVELVRSRLPAGLQPLYLAYPYLHEEMPAALASADLVVSRAGASTLGEYPAYGLPAMLVPYPHAWRYQYVNAHYLEENGAAVVVADGDLDSKLLPLVTDLFSNASRLKGMGVSMRKLAKPQAAASIAQLLLMTAGGRS